jgi:hypothetical protein
VKHGEKERRELTRELMHAQVNISQRIREAQKRLLATGSPTPDAWLAVRAVGQLSSQHTAAMKGKRETAVLMDSGADLQALEAVCRKMGVALLRLEAQIGPAGEAKAASTSSAYDPLEQHDMPLTLHEFIRTNCVLGEKLPEARLDRLTKSLQNAARRKGTGVVLPQHVGRWRPGRKKYYRPSQLRAVWPGLVQHLPYLPALKSAKS